ncbi:MAG: hypothetical protein KBT77_06580 [Thalassolituus oleivorans]|uniref:hypothetical protein n=1 Tax=Thalassolituus oleivorans TaxID=187493 RepID=UPI001B67C74D|nr:hypothetical protein [Thalassolituus oleivorans]MBQ0726999.1 hypothetical protein [Thalassolituus oleivorans]
MSAPPHTTWINLSNQNQWTWLGTQLKARGINEEYFHSYIRGELIRYTPDFINMKEQVRLIEISWRSKMSREKTTTITITKQTQARIQRYCASKKNQITPLELLEEFSKNLKSRTYSDRTKAMSENREIKKSVILAVEGIYENLTTLKKTIEHISHQSHIAHTALEETGSLDLLGDPAVLSKAEETLPKGLKEGLDAILRIKEHVTRMGEDALTTGTEFRV